MRVYNKPVSATGQGFSTVQIVQRGNNSFSADDSYTVEVKCNSSF